LLTDFLSNQIAAARYSRASATVAGRRFTDELGALNQRLAALCDRVVLMVAGQPLQIKPSRLC